MRNKSSWQYTVGGLLYLAMVILTRYFWELLLWGPSYPVLVSRF